MSLSSRLSYVTLGATVLLAASLTTIGRLGVSEVEGRLDANVVTGKAVLWEKVLSGVFSAMESNATTLTRHREALTGVAAGDVLKVENEGAPIVVRLAGLGVADGLTVVGKEGQPLFQQPRDVAVSPESPVLRAARADGRPARGLERTGARGVVAVVAFPLFERGQPIGAAAFVRVLDAALADFKTHEGSDFAIRAPDGTVERSTDAHLFKLLEVEPTALDQSTYRVGQAGERLFSVVSLPLRDAQGQALARLVAVKDDTDSITRVTWLNRAALAVGAVLVLLAVVVVHTYIRRALAPLRRVVAVTRAVAQGELCHTVQCHRQDELGEVASAVNAMIGQLRTLVEKIASSTAEVSASAREMTAVTDDVRQGLSDQNSSTDQVATAVTEMSATVEEVARSTVAAADAARDADVQARTGREVVRSAAQAIGELSRAMQETDHALERLEQDSLAIGSVIDVIRGIAEQTNLLALNAAIEAARAGEQGRGFAVVADEVRTLASRTKQSTGQIRETIERLQARAREAAGTMKQGLQLAQAGVAQADKADGALERITGAVSSISDMNSQVASASQEQSTVARDININVVRISEIARASLQRAEQTATASRRLAELANELDSLVASFRLSEAEAVKS